MKKIILFLSIAFILSSCNTFSGLLSNKKRNEEFEYFTFNDRNKEIVNKNDIYVTKLTKIDSLNTALYEVRTKFANDAKHIGSWDFSSKPSQSLQDEINGKAVELGANYIILFEKRNCEYIDLARGTITGLEGNNCYIILYYNLPTEKLESRHNLISDHSASDDKVIPELTEKPITPNNLPTTPQPSKSTNKNKK